MANPYSGITRANRGFYLTTSFKGYNSRDDTTKLEPGVLVKGSRNVSCNAGDKLSPMKGYTLCGQSAKVSQNNPGGAINKTSILGAYDFESNLGFTRNIRILNPTVNVVDPDGTNIGSARPLIQYFYRGYWYSLRGDNTSATGSEAYSFTRFWDDASQKFITIFVDGSDSTVGIYTWNGAIALPGAILGSGTRLLISSEDGVFKTWRQRGFDATGKFYFEGIEYTYTGIDITGYELTGITPSLPTTGLITSHPVVQSTNFVPSSSMTGIDLPTFDFVETKDNHLVVGSTGSRNIYVSKVNNYLDYTFSAPREIGEGAILQVDEVPTAIIVQESDLYISAGRNQWYRSRQVQTTVSNQAGTFADGGAGSIVSTNIVTESYYLERLKTIQGQGVQSKYLLSKIFNNVIFVSHEPTVSTLGRVIEQKGVATPMLESVTLTSISDIIINDMNSYDFTDGQVFYYRDSVYIAIPKHGTVIAYNLKFDFWEAPFDLPISRFSVIDNQLVGHSYFTNESYYLFTGTNNNGVHINATAKLAYMNMGKRETYKSFDEWYSEGYIQGKLNMRLNLDFSQQQYDDYIDNSDKDILFATSDEDALGITSLGQNPLGDIDEPSSLSKFRIKHTYTKTDFFEVQPIYYSNELNAYWELLAFGPNAKESNNETVIIKR